MTEQAIVTYVNHGFSSVRSVHFIAGSLPTVSERFNPMTRESDREKWTKTGAYDR
jgi:hypothetical protein